MPALNNMSSRGAERRGALSGPSLIAPYRNSTGFSRGASSWMIPKARR